MVTKKVSVRKNKVVRTQKNDCEYKNSCENIKEEFINMTKQLKKDIKKDPIKAVGIAYGAGVVLSSILNVIRGGRK